MEAHAAAPSRLLASSSQSLQSVVSASLETEPFRGFLASALSAGKLSEARLRVLLLRQHVLAPLQVAAGRAHPVAGVTHDSQSFLTGALNEITTQHFKSGGLSDDSPAAHMAAQSAVMAIAGALWQGVVLLQLRAVAPAQRERAIRRARREGFLQVRPLSDGLVSSSVCTV